MRKTKIICTIGPATSSPEILEELVLAGMDVARFNCSHGKSEEMAITIADIKQLRKQTDIPVAILIDLKGPEIRTGKFKGGKTRLFAGQKFTIHSEPIEGDDSRMCVSYKKFYEAVKPGTPILIDDGLVELVVEEVKDKLVHTKVVVGDELSDYKGVNLPNTPTNLPALDEKDLNDLYFAVTQEVDFVAVSFARNAADIEAARNVLAEHGGEAINIIAKIENQQGIDNIDEILEAADGIMVARGDLGVEIAPEQVPLVQKRLIRQCYQSGKPSITATQMLDSMVNNSRPTRAEVSDVANAILDGTSCLMLSGETAIGKHPIKSLTTMVNIAKTVENEIDYWTEYENTPTPVCLNVPDAISHAAFTTARDLDAAAIVVMTFSGNTARLTSRFRPACPILAMTVSEISQYQLNMSWGVRPYLVPLASSTDAVFNQAEKIAKESDLVNCGDTIVLAGGTTSGKSGTTNTIRVEQV